MDSTAAILEYNAEVPNSADLLSTVCGDLICDVRWHHMEGDDAYGHLLEMLELRLSSRTLYLRPPRRERAYFRDNVEFASLNPAATTTIDSYSLVTATDMPLWTCCLDSAISRVDLLIDLKHEGFALYYGIRLQCDSGHSIGYHYQWGQRIGDPVPRKPLIVIDGPDPPPETGWRFVPWHSE